MRKHQAGEGLSDRADPHERVAVGRRAAGAGTLAEAFHGDLAVTNDSDDESGHFVLGEEHLAFEPDHLVEEGISSRGSKPVQAQTKSEYEGESLLLHLVRSPQEIMEVPPEWKISDDAKGSALHASGNKSVAVNDLRGSPRIDIRRQDAFLVAAAEHDPVATGKHIEVENGVEIRIGDLRLRLQHRKLAFHRHELVIAEERFGAEAGGIHNVGASTACSCSLSAKDWTSIAPP
jgi:hypothetical protein